MIKKKNNKIKIRVNTEFEDLNFSANIYLGRPVYYNILYTFATIIINMCTCLRAYILFVFRNVPITNVSDLNPVHAMTLFYRGEAQIVLAVVEGGGMLGQL